MRLGIWEFIRDLKNKHRIYSNKQRKFISHIVVYVDELRVYKVIVFGDTRKKNRHKRGVDDVKIYDKNNATFPMPTLKKEIDGSENGKKIFMYYPQTDIINCYEGENVGVNF